MKVDGDDLRHGVDDDRYLGPSTVGAKGSVTIPYGQGVIQATHFIFYLYRGNSQLNTLNNGKKSTDRTLKIVTLTANSARLEKISRFKGRLF